MDKNMINIDDLLKQRLPYGEERQRPGAWLQMRELLDQQMPVANVPVPGAAFNWRRMFGYLAGLALLATVSIGSYQVATSYRSDDATAQTAVRAANTNAGNALAMNNATPATPAASINNTTTTTGNTIQEGKQNATPASDNHSNPNKNNNTGIAATSVAGNNGKHNNEASKNAGNTLAKQQGQAIANTSGTNAQKTAANTHANVLADNNKHTVAKAIASSTPADKPVITASNNTAKQQSTTEPAKNTAPERNFASGAKVGINLPGADKPVVQNGIGSTAKNTNTQNPANTSGTGTTAGGGKTNTPQQTNKQLIDKVETKETYDRVAGWRKDTVATGKVEWASNEPAMMLANNTLSSNAVPADVSMIPNSSAIASSEAANNEEKLVPLANFKVESKNHYAKARRFEQMMQNAKTNMGTVRFYPGLILGGNTTVGNNSMSGFQFGVTGMLSLNDKWGILSELKYAQRFKKDSRIQDNYTEGATPYIFAGGGTVYQYKSVDHYINYSTISNLELPIALNYSVKRFNFLGGVNLTYNFGINVEEILREPVMQYTAPLSTAEIASTTARLNSQPTLSSSDFKARTSLGFLLGAAYQISPAFKLDMRMTRNLVDNAKSTGAKKISKELYSSPTLQLNLNYRFSSNKNRPAKAR